MRSFHFGYRLWFPSEQQVSDLVQHSFQSRIETRTFDEMGFSETEDCSIVFGKYKYELIIFQGEIGGEIESLSWALSESRSLTGENVAVLLHMLELWTFRALGDSNSFSEWLGSSSMQIESSASLLQSDMLAPSASLFGASCSRFCFLHFALLFLNQT